MFGVCRFRPICAADVLSQSAKSSVARADISQYRPVLLSHQNIARTTSSSSVQPPVAVSRRSSRTFLLPSPSSAFSVPPPRHVDTVPPTACRNADVGTQRHGTPDVEYRHRRRATVKEMAQSYDRATQQEVSARRLSCTFQPTLPTTTTSTTTITTTCISNSVSNPVTAETKRDHYTTTSVFSLSGSRPHAEKGYVGSKGQGHETKLKRLYCNTVESLHKSLDNFTRLRAPFAAADKNRKSVQETSQLDLRRSASSQHITDAEMPPDRRGSYSFRNNNNNNNNDNHNNSVATFPLSSRHHSVSIHTLSNLTAQNFRDFVRPELEKSRNDVTGSGGVVESLASRKHGHSSWNVMATPAAERSDIGGNRVEKDVRESGDSETKTAEIKVVLGKNFAVDPVMTSPRSLTVRKSPSLSQPNSSSVTTSLSMAFLSPRPIRKMVHHLEPLMAESKARPTSAAALERFRDAQQLLLKTADLTSSAVDEQRFESSSPCRTLIDLVRESHLNVFPSSTLAPSPSTPSGSNSWVTSPELRNTDTTPTGGERTQQRRISELWNDHGMWNDRDRNRSSASVSSDRNQVVGSVSPGSRRRDTPTHRTEISVPSPFIAALPRSGNYCILCRHTLMPTNMLWSWINFVSK